MKTILPLYICIAFTVSTGTCLAQQTDTTCLSATHIAIDSCKNLNYGDGNFEITTPVANCVSHPESEVWASFTVPSGPNKDITIVSNTYIGSAGLAVQVMSGTCSSLVQIACINNVSGNMFQTETVTLADLSPGTYYIRLTNDNGTFNGGASVCISVTPLGLSENSSETPVTVYPNPFSTQTKLSFAKQITEGTITVRSMDGKEIITQRFGGSEFIFEKGKLHPGIYFAQITQDSDAIINIKIVVQ